MNGHLAAGSVQEDWWQGLPYPESIQVIYAADSSYVSSLATVSLSYRKFAQRICSFQRD